MATPSPTKHVSECYVLDSVTTDSASSSSGPYRDSFSGDEEQQHLDDYIAERTRRTFVGRVLTTLGMPIRHRSRQREEYDYFSTPKDQLPDGLLKKKSSHRDLRRSRRSKTALLRRSLLAIPILALVFFGALHLTQVFIGRTNLLWDLDTYDEYLPNWGKSGQPGAGLSDYPTDATRDVIPIPCHSHNDYWRRVPLFDAIHWGCTGVEADVWLFDEELYVGHNMASLTRNRTFRNLYVNPLVELLDSMNPSSEFANATGHGVFDEDPSQTLVLLVDFKTAGRESWPYVHEQLSALREKDYLSFWDGQKFNSRAVTVVGTGNAPFDKIIESQTYRDIFFDAPLDKLWESPRSPTEIGERLRSRSTSTESDEGIISSSLLSTPSNQGHVGTDSASTSADAFTTATSYYASVSFTKTVGFVWRGHLSSRQIEIVRGQIRGAKSRGLKARYWDTPSWPRSLRNHVWHVLMKEGADVLNVDDLKSAATENWKMRVHGFW